MFNKARKEKANRHARHAGYESGRCNCIECMDERAGNRMGSPNTCADTSDKVEKSFTMSQARAAFIDYHGDVKKHLDFSNMRDYGGGEFIVTAKTFEEVTGMVKIGAGAYATVYALSETKVLKVIRGRDEGYAKFVKACKENRGNPYLPKILYDGEWAGKQVYVLERLAEDAPDKSETYEIKDKFAAALRHRDRNPFITFVNDDIRVAANIVREIGGNDLHHGNMMFRGDTPVITDPCAY